MYRREFSPPNQSYFLFGPRGTGKSTFLKNYYPKAVFFNLLMEREYLQFLAQPELFYQRVQAVAPGQWIIVDEVQRLPSLLNYVHQLIEEKKWKFVLTGSSARKLKRSGVNLLAGRALTKHFHPFTARELGDDFDLEKVLTQGSIPLIWESEDPQDTLQSYIETYLRLEIREEGLIKNLGGFSRFLKGAALLHGQILNTSNIARECEVARTTVHGFFEILVDTLIAKELPAYETKLRVRERKKSKFYFFDPGLVRALRGDKGSIDNEERGSLLEGLVFEYLQSQKNYHKNLDEIYYWQPAESKTCEVDFLVKRGKKMTAIEVKSSTKLRPEDLKGLKAISDLPQLERKILLYRGEEILYLKSEGIEVIPVAKFFSKNLEEQVRGK